LIGVAAFAQKNYVSTPIVKAMESGKFYMCFDMVQGGYTLTVETAFRAGVSMSRVDMNGREMVSMVANGKAYSLDEAGKTWNSMPMGAVPSVPGKLNFVRQGKCLVNGQKGWYFDEYNADGNTIRFYYNSDKVSVIEMADSGPMVLRSFSSTIPSKMYFCLGKGWSGSGSVPPPQCSQPWTDSGHAVELAGVSETSTVSVSNVQTVSTPVLASNFNESDQPRKPRMDRKVTEEGVWLALEQIMKESEGKTDEQLEEEFLEYNGEVSRLFFSGVVTGEMIEGLIARASVCPHPAILTTTGTLLSEIGELELGRRYYEYAISVDATIVGARYGLLEYYFDLGNYSKARGLVNVILEMGPNGLEDGRAYLYKAMLQLQDGQDKAAVNSLFKSLSLGYFDENSLLMLTSVLNQLELAFAMGVIGERDPMPLLHEVFSDTNLALLKKAITYSKENEITPNTTQIHFGPPAPRGLEAMRKYYRGQANSLEIEADTYDRYAETLASKDPNVVLCLSKGLGHIMEGIDRASTYISKEGEPLSTAPVVRFTAGSYERLTSSLGMEYGVSSFYLPDMRTFWCLYALNQYYAWQMRYEQASLDKAFHPSEYKMWKSYEKVTHNNYSAKESALLDIQIKEEAELGRQCDENYNNWFAAHPDASDSTCARAYRRFMLPYRIMSEVDHPLERLNVIEIPRDEQLFSLYVDYYNSNIEPLLAAWWEDMDLYSEYCLSESVRNWVKFNTASNLIVERELMYNAAADDGESFASERDFYERKREALMEQERRDRAESLKEFNEDYQALKIQEELIPPPLFDNVGDFNAKISTPLGDIRIGYINGAWGIKPENNVSLKDYLALALEGTAVGDFLYEMGVEKITPSRELKIKEDMKKKLYDKGKDVAEKLIGASPAAAAVALLKAKNGDLIQRKTEDLKKEVYRDKGGNLWVKDIKDDSMDFNGMAKYSRQDISVGKARVRRDACSFNILGVEFEMGSYHRTRQ